MGDFIFGVVDRTTLAYFLLAGLIVAIVAIGRRGFKARRLEMRRRAGTGPRSQFEKRRRG